MMERSKILFVLHMPPPLHGAGMVGQCIHDSRLVNEIFDCHWVNLSASANLEEIDKASWAKFRMFLHIYRSVRRELRDFHPDYAYITPSATTGPGFLKDYLIARCLRRHHVQLVAHLHNKGYSLLGKHRLYDRLLRRFFRDMKVILLSKRLYPDIQHYVPMENVAICHNGVNLPERQAQAESHEIPQILFLSNLLVSKGVPDLIEVCSLLKSRGCRFRAVIVGAESADYDRDRLETEIYRRSLSDTLSYEGKKYGKEKDAILANSDVLLYPSRNDAFPLVILEAMSASLPVVASDEGGIADEVEDGVSGYICPGQQITAFADAVERLLTDPQLRRKMGRAGFQRYAELFTQDVFEKRFVEVLCSIFPNSSKTP